MTLPHTGYGPPPVSDTAFWILVVFAICNLILNVVLVYFSYGLFKVYLEIYSKLEIVDD